MLVEAKRYLEKHEKFKVVGAFLSPSSDHHVISKLGPDAITARDRFVMCELAVRDLAKEISLEHWAIVPDAWECTRPKYTYAHTHT
jgi:hypothetical protein